MLPENTILQGRYQILEPIGRGGMGAVYKALDTRLRSVVALKETLLTGEVARRAFEREAQLLAGLRHSALPKVSDHFTEGEGQFLVMEFIPGADLGKLMSQREGPFPVAEVLRWADVLLDALEYLHGHTPPIIHRDIKPQNMKLTDRGEIILLDFGLAKGAAVQATRATTTSSIFGYTPHYAPLEQIQGTGTDPRSDLYALAATLYHLLTAAPPPDALTRAAAKINEDPDPLTPANTLNPDVSGAVAAVLARAMAQKPDQRFATAAAMRAALRTAAQGGFGTVTLPDATAKLPDEAETMVRVRSSEAMAARAAATVASTGNTAVQSATGTTMTPASPPAPSARGRPWVLPLAGLGGLLVIAAAFVLLRGGAASPPPSPTTDPNTAVVYAIVADTETPTTAPTTRGLTDAEILETAAVLQTAEAQQRADDIATARALVNATDGAATQTAVALTPTATALQATETTIPATEAPTEAPTAPPATAAPGPTAVPRPTNSPRPTNTPAPTATADQPSAVIVDVGGGGQFRGSANLGETDPSRGRGGSCIEGRVTRADGSGFARLGVQVDLRGNTREAPIVGDGVYSICGLAAGEWGVSIFQADGVDISGAEQRAHQVRVQLTGTPGEIVYVNFRATETFVVPTPTPSPMPSLYDGVWRGTNSGTTTTGSYPPGRFEIEVRNNAIYRISVDGPSCPFETYPNYPAGIAISGTSFAVSGSVFNPITGANDTITVSVSGTFVSTSVANGTLSAQQGGAACANATWNARK